jgi:hypothetical protein
VTPWRRPWRASCRHAPAVAPPLPSRPPSAKTEKTRRRFLHSRPSSSPAADADPTTETVRRRRRRIYLRRAPAPTTGGSERARAGANRKGRKAGAERTRKGTARAWFGLALEMVRRDYCLREGSPSKPIAGRGRTQPAAVVAPPSDPG